jgi:hypothetical protein
MEDEENKSAANSEIRFITLELMKIAQRSGRSFSQVALEYLNNTVKMQMMIYGEEERVAQRAKRGALSRQK